MYKGLYCLWSIDKVIRHPNWFNNLYNITGHFTNTLMKDFIIGERDTQLTHLEKKKR